MEPHDLEAMANALDVTGEYRVLRKIRLGRVLNPPDGESVRNAIFLDLETTGLDPARDEVIELAMVPFSYGATNGRVYEVGEPFQRFRQPASPISPGITNLTGITNEMVDGKKVDPAEVAQVLAGASLVVAHNANFDRRFAERLYDGFRQAAWACSMTQVPWNEEGFHGARLEYLAMKSGFFFNPHRAVDDCRAAIELLARPLPISGVPAMRKLLDLARKTTCRLWAENSPFELKDQLKVRGYRWNDGTDGRPRAWNVDVLEEHAQAELDFLRKEIYQRNDVDIAWVRITARERFSDRTWPWLT